LLGCSSLHPLPQEIIESLSEVSIVAEEFKWIVKLVCTHPCWVNFLAGYDENAAATFQGLLTTELRRLITGVADEDGAEMFSREEQLKHIKSLLPPHKWSSSPIHWLAMNENFSLLNKLLTVFPVEGDQLELLSLALTNREWLLVEHLLEKMKPQQDLITDQQGFSMVWLLCYFKQWPLALRALEINSLAAHQDTGMEGWVDKLPKDIANSQTHLKALSCQQFQEIHVKSKASSENLNGLSSVFRVLYALNPIDSYSYDYVRPAIKDEYNLLHKKLSLLLFDCRSTPYLGRLPSEVQLLIGVHLVHMTYTQHFPTDLARDFVASFRSEPFLLREFKYLALKFISHRLPSEWQRNQDPSFLPWQYDASVRAVRKSFNQMYLSMREQRKPRHHLGKVTRNRFEVLMRDPSQFGLSDMVGFFKLDPRKNTQFRLSFQAVPMLPIKTMTNLCEICERDIRQYWEESNGAWKEFLGLQVSAITEQLTLISSHLLFYDQNFNLIGNLSNYVIDKIYEGVRRGSRIGSLPKRSATRNFQKSIGAYNRRLEKVQKTLGLIPIGGTFKDETLVATLCAAFSLERNPKIELGCVHLFAKRIGVKFKKTVSMLQLYHQYPELFLATLIDIQVMAAKKCMMINPEWLLTDPLKIWLVRNQQLSLVDALRGGIDLPQPIGFSAVAENILLASQDRDLSYRLVILDMIAIGERYPSRVSEWSVDKLYACIGITQEHKRLRFAQLNKVRHAFIHFNEKDESLLFSRLNEIQSLTNKELVRLMNSFELYSPQHQQCVEWVLPKVSTPEIRTAIEFMYNEKHPNVQWQQYQQQPEKYVENLRACFDKAMQKGLFRSIVIHFDRLEELSDEDEAALDSGELHLNQLLLHSAEQYLDRAHQIDKCQFIVPK